MCSNLPCKQRRRRRPISRRRRSEIRLQQRRCQLHQCRQHQRLPFHHLYDRNKQDSQCSSTISSICILITRGKANRPFTRMPNTAIHVTCVDRCTTYTSKISSSSTSLQWSSTLPKKQRPTDKPNRSVPRLSSQHSTNSRNVRPWKTTRTKTVSYLSSTPGNTRRRFAHHLRPLHFS